MTARGSLSSARPPAGTRPGVGVDVVEVAGLARRLEAEPGLLDVLFTPAERAECAARRVPARAFASCFAAKEAFVKALGRGLNATGPDGWLKEIEVSADRDGGPCLRLGAAPQRALRRRSLGYPRLALGCAGGFALATVILLPEAHDASSAGRLPPLDPAAPDERTRCA